jgi:hypothetical protein
VVSRAIRISNNAMSVGEVWILGRLLSWEHVRMPWTTPSLANLAQVIRCWKAAVRTHSCFSLSRIIPAVEMSRRRNIGICGA